MKYHVLVSLCSGQLPGHQQVQLHLLQEGCLQRELKKVQPAGATACEARGLLGQAAQPRVPISLDQQSSGEELCVLLPA